MAKQQKSKSGARPAAAKATGESAKLGDLVAVLGAIGASQAMIEFETDGTIITANDNFLGAFGYELGEVVGKHHGMFVDPAYKASAEYSQFWEVLRSGTFQAGEFKRIHKNGDEVWIQASYNPVLGADGKAVKVVKIAVDITAAKIESLASEAKAAQLSQMVESMPVGVMMCDTDNFEINYMNKFSTDTLKTLQEHLPVKVDDMIGQTVDVFHKVPSHQRGILSNPKNLPHQAQIGVGPEVLDLLVTPILDTAGEYMGPMLTWSVITEKVKADADSARLLQMVDNMPINVLTCDPNDDFKINYINKTSVNTLRGVQEHLPVAADQLLGQSIDIFHKVPSHQRNILADPKNLPHKAKIKLGPETLDLQVSAVTGQDGSYLGPMLAWDVITRQVQMADNVGEVVRAVSAAATEMQSSAQSMTATAEETSRQSQTVAGAAEQATGNVQTVAAAAEEMAKSVEEISRQVTHSAAIADRAVGEAESTNLTVESLAEAAQKIGEVVSLISDIANQTNLLALNATIEAARAGDAGKGFAVMASEVKSLANQTAKATEDIASQISSMQDATTGTVGAIKGISATISELSDTAAAIAAAVEEQGAATQEIARNVQEAAQGTQEVSSNITGVNQAAQDTGKAAAEVLEAAGELAKHGETLNGEIASFLGEEAA